MTLPTNALLNITPPASGGKGGVASSSETTQRPLSDDAQGVFSAHFDEALQTQSDSVSEPMTEITDELLPEPLVLSQALAPSTPPVTETVIDGRQAVVLDGKLIPAKLASVTVTEEVVTDDGPLLTEPDDLARVMDQSLKRDQSMLDQGRNLALAFNNKGAESLLPVSSLGAESGASSLASQSSVATNLLNPATQAAAAPKLSASVDVPLGDSRWQNDFSQRVVWYAKTGVQSAEIKLNPAHLGPVDIRIEVNDEQASVTFYAKNSATREAIEASIVRLKEMLNEEGMDLAESFVSEHGFNEQSQSQDSAQKQGGGVAAEGGNNDVEITRGPVLSATSPARLLVDYYV